jgi:hypothetical protein
MNYVWTNCPKCGCQLAIQFAERPDRIAGSVRRWSNDRSINDGRLLEIPRASVGEDGGFTTNCVCGAEIAVRPELVEHASTEP